MFEATLIGGSSLPTGPSAFAKSLVGLCSSTTATFLAAEASSTATRFDASSPEPFADLANRPFSRLRSYLFFRFLDDGVMFDLDGGGADSKTRLRPRSASWGAAVIVDLCLF
jgi:hypothetical protein